MDEQRQHLQLYNNSKSSSGFHHHSHAASTPSFHHSYPSSTSVTDADEPLDHKTERDAQSFPAHPDPSLAHPTSIPAAPRPKLSTSSLASLHSHLASLRLAPADVTSLPSSPTLFDPSSAPIRSDILSLILQYLSDAGLSASYATLSDEAALSTAASPATVPSLSRYKRLRRSLLDGDYQTAHRLALRLSLPPGLVYCVHLQEYLELIDKAEWQRAYTVLVRRLKPLEGRSDAERKEFADACYLLTCKSVREADSFRDWSLTDSRQRLVGRIEKLLQFAGPLGGSGAASVTAAVAASDVLPPPPPPPPPPPQRLVTLLQQAVAYQLSISRYHPLSPPNVSTLLSDYSTPAIPNTQLLHISPQQPTGKSGGSGGIKSLCFLGDEGSELVAAGNDGVLHRYSSTTGHISTAVTTPSSAASASPTAHRGRIWDVASDRLGRLVVSASADSTLHALSINTQQQRVLTGHSGDVYSVSIHAAGDHAASGGYDGTVRVWDVTRGTCVRMWGDGVTGGSVVSTAFTQWGNLLLAADKARQLHFFDLLSGVCVHSLYVPLASVLSLAVSPDGGYVLLGCQNNSVRLLDMRTLQLVQKYVGVCNMSRSFVRVGWCCNAANSGTAAGSYPMSGSESGEVVLWQRDTAETVGVLAGHEGAVFSVQWNERKSLLASCGDDGTVRTWGFDPAMPFHGQTGSGDDSD